MILSLTCVYALASLFLFEYGFPSIGLTFAKVASGGNLFFLPPKDIEQMKFRRNVNINVTSWKKARPHSLLLILCMYWSELVTSIESKFTSHVTMWYQHTHSKQNHLSARKFTFVHVFQSASTNAGVYIVCVHNIHKGNPAQINRMEKKTLQTFYSHWSDYMKRSDATLQYIYILS